ncbi:MAG TPA: glycerate-2-kinase family protein, partial [Gemmatimonadales bacterium]
MIRSPWAPLIDAFVAAVAAVEPGACVRRVLAADSRPSSRPHILAVGKAAIGMAEAGVEAVRDWEYDRAPGLVIAAEPGSVPGCEVLTGDHPVPGLASVYAAEAIAAFIEQVPAGSPVWFLLSGGASSLMAGPEPPLTTSDVQETFEVLLRSGLDIQAMNSVRKRMTRWGGGKLGRALARAQVLQIVISDVIGDDLAAIGSGPCVPDPVDTPAVIARLREARAYDRLPAATRMLLTDMAEGRRAEPPKPGDSALE